MECTDCEGSNQMELNCECVGRLMKMKQLQETDGLAVGKRGTGFIKSLSETR
jgi:hypothetical protein